VTECIIEPIKVFYGLSEGKKKRYMEKSFKNLRFMNLQGSEKLCALFEAEGRFYCSQNLKYRIGERIHLGKKIVISVSVKKVQEFSFKDIFCLGYSQEEDAKDYLRYMERTDRLDKMVEEFVGIREIAIREWFIDFLKKLGIDYYSNSFAEVYKIKDI